MTELLAVVSEAPPPMLVTDRRVVAVVRRAAERKLPLFAAYPDVEKSDLVQEGLLALAGAAGKFDSAAGKWTTFAYVVASRTMIDVYRQRHRQRGRDESGGRSEVTSDPEPREDADLVGWVERVRDAARSMYGSKVHRVGRKFYRVDRVAAVVLLQARLKVSAEGLRWILDRRPELLAALGFQHVPGPRLFEDAEEVLREVRPLIARAGLPRAGAGSDVDARECDV